jgi:hypothetical protein
MQGFWPKPVDGLSAYCYATRWKVKLCPLRQAVKDVLDAGAPYTHLPYHVSIQNGRPFKISNDHCLLDTVPPSIS